MIHRPAQREAVDGAGIQPGFTGSRVEGDSGGSLGAASGGAVRCWSGDGDGVGAPGETAARRHGPPDGSKLDADAEFLLNRIHATPHLTLAEVQARLRHERGVSAGIATF